MTHVRSIAIVLILAAVLLLLTQTTPVTLDAPVWQTSLDTLVTNLDTVRATVPADSVTPPDSLIP